MSTAHEYKNFKIIKRGGRTHRTSAAKTGYVVFTTKQTMYFGTLREAKFWVDTQAVA